jgi:hypothetical protein
MFLYQYQMNPRCGLDDILISLLDAEEYRDAYLSDEPMPRIGGEDVHGPYLLGRLKFTSFRPIKVSLAIRAIESFLQKANPPLTPRQFSLETVVIQPLVRADHIFALRPSSGAEHQLGYMLGDFLELVVVTRGKAQLLNLVMGYD